MPTAILILLLYFLLSNSADSCPNAKLECGNMTYSYSYPFFTDNSPPGCRTFHKIQCLDSWPVVQFNQQGLFFHVKNISSVEKTIIVHDIDLILSHSQSECLLFYNFTAPIRHVNVSSLSVLANSSRSSFNCSMVEQDYHRNIFCNLSHHAPCKNYDIFIYPMNQPKNAPPPPSCFPPNIGLRFNWKLSFEEYNNLSLLSAGYSYDLEDRADCFSCRITVTNGNAREDPGNKQCLGDADNSNSKKESTVGKGKSKMGVIIGVAVGAAVFLLGLVCIALYIRKKRRPRSPSSKFLTRSFQSEPYPTDLESSSLGQQTHVFSYEELEKATNRFDSSKELGSGGFGNVYKGELRDGRTVAIKRLFENNYNRIEQFLNEVSILSRLRHQNLVCLYGCTSRHSREYLLVYEYVPNGTIADHLHGPRATERALTWPVRLNIAIETADALAYLHAIEPPIIHRDVKSNNILLDVSYHVKVADFGLSRLFPLDVTHVSTAPQGTPGYVDPEYHKCYQLTDKSDVYSFGVVLVELISSKPAVDLCRRRDEINLANMAINKIQKCELDQLVDPELGYESNWATKKMITMVAELAFRCLQPDGDMRPPIKEVLEVLKGIEKEGFRGEKGGEGDVGMDDDDGLLKNIPPFSPDSVTAKWVSRSTTPNTST
ncbi:LEAF RUST 10 DISEASE-RESISTANCEUS RECEPTOR-LIKE PROTEIN KINASE-like 1.1 isoform X3 [Typha latifolia]|uniref:LEAF RUST 10 DISEASE-RESISTANCEUS RECEPTOR-LIKE PROTEIN KINASE-like 1.1 isoform X3 n=1 Tax=Typha latifolia TaxID=4733 RepID=UPI003C2B1648